jgi:hypothetical protein
MEFLEARLSLLVLGEIVHEAGEEHLSPERNLPTASSIGKIEPSRLRPATTQFVPVIWRSWPWR